MNHPEQQSTLFFRQALKAINEAMSVQNGFPRPEKQHESIASIMHENPDLPVDIVMAAYDQWQREQRTSFELSLRYGAVETDMYEAMGTFAHQHGAASAETLHTLFLTFMKSYMERLTQVSGMTERLLMVFFDKGVSVLLEELPPGHEFEESEEYTNLQKIEVVRELLIDWGLAWDESSNEQ